MNINNEKFNNFIQSKGERYYSDKANGYNYYFFKIPYDADCDFIHVINKYTCHSDPDGKPGIHDKSELGGIYAYSLGLLFNAGYYLRDFLADGMVADMKNHKTLDVAGYHKQIGKEVSAEILKRIEAGQFDREAAAALISHDDRDIQYYKEYREYEFAKSDFLDGKRPDKLEIFVTYETQGEIKISGIARKRGIL